MDACATESSFFTFPSSLPRRPSLFPPLIHVIDRLLGDPAHGVMSLLIRRHAHLDKQREPSRFVITQTVLARVGHISLARV